MLHFNENITFKSIMISDGMELSAFTQVVSSTSLAEKQRNQKQLELHDEVITQTLTNFIFSISE